MIEQGDKLLVVTVTVGRSPTNPVGGLAAELSSVQYPATDWDQYSAELYAKASAELARFVSLILAQRYRWGKPVEVSVDLFGRQVDAILRDSTPKV